jgi:putative endopeptidase
MRKIAYLALTIVVGCRPASPEISYIDATSMDSSVRPQDDFFNYANGTWIKKTEIPASQIGWGSFFSLSDQSVANTHSILDSLSRLSGLPQGSIQQQVADLYGSIMDSAQIESLGLKPLDSDLTDIKGIKDVPGVFDVVAKEYHEGAAPLFTFYANADDKNSSMDVAHFDQGGLGLPNKDYYFNQDTSILHIKKAYVDYMTKVFTLVGMDAAAASKAAESVLTAETALAKVSKEPVALRDPNANYHKIPVADLEKKAGELPWKKMLTRLGVNADTVLVGQPEFYAGLYHALKSLPLDDWKNYLTFHLVDNFTPVLGHEVQDAAFAFSSLLSGTKEQLPRWKRASQQVDQLMGDALGQLYVQKYFPPEAKQRMHDLVDSLQAAFADHIRSLDWMSDSTKQKALAKLNAIRKKIGYPDKWKDYSSIHISRSGALENYRQCQEYDYQRQLKKIGHPVDRSEWYMTPPTIDAYYSALSNDINFPAGILQPPFFYQNGDDALNFGAIGMVIGHEMTHGFDDQGRQYDADGNLKSWWTSEDSARFVRKVNLVVQQYDGYLAIDTFHINGNLTLGENLADVGGLAIAYSAFKKTAQGHDTTRIDGLTPDERFFRSFAQAWRIKVRPETIRSWVLNNPHSTPQFRVNGPVSNLNAFYDTYGLKPGDKLYRPDSLRAHIW